MNSGLQNDLQVSQLLFGHLEKAKLHVESIIDELPDIFCIIDAHGHIFKGNSLLGALLKTSEEFLILRQLSELFTPGGWLKFTERLPNDEAGLKDSLKDSLHPHFELALDGLTGPEKVIIWTVKRFSHGGVNHRNLYTVIGRDISISVTLERKNQELEHQKGRIQAIINSTDFGFFTIDRHLIIQGESSNKTVEIFGQELVGKDITEVLNLPKVEFQKFADIIFQGSHWEVLKPFSTRECVLGPLTLRVEFMPILESKWVTRILGIVTDITALKALQKRDQRQQKANLSVTRILRSKGLFIGVMHSVDRLADSLSDLPKLKMAVHTLKGELGIFECTSAMEICHEWETSWKSETHFENNSRYFKRLQADIKSFTDEYSEILNLDFTESVTISVESLLRFLTEMKALNGSPQLSASLRRAFSLPLKSHLAWLNDLWLSLASRLGKRVEPIIWEDSTGLFMEPYRALLQSLVHAVRNTIDHGIELPSERSAAGKPDAGSLTIALSQNGQNYEMRLKDDGRGVDLEKIRAISRKRGLTVPENDFDTLELLFAPEFSSSEEVTDLSGRGVGLSAIRYEARQLDGDAGAINIPGKAFELWIRFRVYEL